MDRVSPNRRLVKLHQSTKDVIYKVANPFTLEKRFLYFISALMIDARVDVKPTLYNLIPTLPGIAHSPVLSQNECTRGYNLQTPLILYTKVAIRPELPVRPSLFVPCPYND